MQAAVKTESISVADYLAAEITSLERHEYLGGQVYAMSGTTRSHNLIALNLATALRTRLKGGACQTFISDIRVHLTLRDDDYYYHPDVVVTCDKRATSDGSSRFVDHPKVIVEVLSESTERVDKQEKFSLTPRLNRCRNTSSWRRTHAKSPSSAARTSGKPKLSPVRKPASSSSRSNSSCRSKPFTKASDTNSS